MNVGSIVMTALVAEGMGLELGIIFLYLFRVKSSKVIGMLFGGTSGLMTAMICFDIIPKAVSKNRIDLVLIGIAIGVTTGLLLDDITPILEKAIRAKSSKKLRMAITLVIGIGLHNIPEGFALGTLSQASTQSIQSFAVILALHSIPEGIALAVLFQEASIKLPILMLIPFILGSIMGTGSLLGCLLSSIGESFIVTALGVAAGIILYIVWEELIPESRKKWNGRMTTVAAILGLILGLLILS